MEKRFTDVLNFWSVSIYARGTDLLVSQQENKTTIPKNKIGCFFGLFLYIHRAGFFYYLYGDFIIDSNNPAKLVA